MIKDMLKRIKSSESESDLNDIREALLALDVSTMTTAQKRGRKELLAATGKRKRELETSEVPNGITFSFDISSFILGGGFTTLCFYLLDSVIY